MFEKRDGFLTISAISNHICIYRSQRISQQRLQ